MIVDKLIWYKEYISGIEILDLQHQQIFAEFNKFYEALNAGEIDKTIIDKFIEALDFYTTTHFETEEEFMKKFNCSYYIEHKRRHDFFRSMYQEIKENKFFRHATGHLFALNLATVSGEWWETHIVTYDKELVCFLKEQNIK